jgi:cell division protein FtsN
MANNGGRRSSGPDNSSLILGILIGMVLGLLVAGGVAWHLSTRPKAFALKDAREAPETATAHVDASPAKAPVAAPSGQPASAVGGNGKRFTFYEILTDKDRHPGHAPNASREAGKAAGGAYFLQAGSFAKPDEADRLKAKLAMIGMEAAVQTADVPGKGTYYRVRLGPYRSTDEMNKANATLKQNGITNAAPVRGAH